MPAKKLLVLACAAVLSGASAGCLGGGDADVASSGRRTRAPRGAFVIGKKKDRAGAEERAVASASALDGYTPESSMARDMRELQERERQQSQLVAKLAETRDGDPARLDRERERLFALRDKIQTYDTALQRFEMAARVRPEKDAGMPPALVPAEMFQDRAVRPAAFGPSGGEYLASRGPERLDDYGRGGDRVTHARVNMNDGSINGNAGGNGGFVREGEQVLYSATGAQNLAAAYESGGTLPVSNSRPAAEPAAKPFAGATVGRSNFSRPASASAGGEGGPERRDGGGKPWSAGGSLYPAGPGSVAQKPTPVPDIYASRRQAEETMWPAGTAMAPPAGTPNSLRPVMKTEVRLPDPAPVKSAPPAASAPAPVSPPPAIPYPAAGDAADDEVFSPSMFLGS